MPTETPEPPPDSDPELAFEHLAQLPDDLITVVDRDGKFIYVNPASQVVLGVAPEDCIGTSAFDRVHPDDRDQTKAAFLGWIHHRRETSFSHVNRQITPDGKAHLISWRVTPVYASKGELLYLTSTGRDIGASRAVEDRIELNENRLRALVAGMLDAVVTIDPFGIIQDANASVLTLLGYQPTELCGQNIRILMPEPHYSAHDSYLADYRRSGKTWILGTTREFEVVRKDGSRIDCELSVSRVDVPGQAEPLFCGTFRDITERRLDQRRLAESEQRLRAIFDQEFQLVSLLDRTGRVISHNATTLRITGTAPLGLEGSRYADAPWWWDDSDRERVLATVETARSKRFARTEVRLRDHNGTARVIDLSIKPIQESDDSVARLLTEGRDITDLVRAQRREVSMFKALASVGENAAILAHEIKNPITSINLALRAVADKIDQDHQVVLQELVERLQRLELLMRETLAFARPLELQPEPVHLATLVDDVVHAFAAQAKASDVVLLTELDDELPAVHADPLRIGEILTNLVLNAIEAVAGTGRPGRVVVHARPDASDGVEVIVEDDGPGIPSELRERLFQPFVTGKSNGTGLGLAICARVAEAHGGSLTNHTSPLGGAHFRLRLPLEPPD